MELNPARAVRRFQHAVDLVRFIRQEHGDYFGIGMSCFGIEHVYCL